MLLCGLRTSMIKLLRRVWDFVTFLCFITRKMFPEE
jgi:hypothetical protein